MRAASCLAAFLASAALAAALAEEPVKSGSSTAIEVRPTASGARPQPRLHPLPPARPRDAPTPPPPAPAAAVEPDGADRAAGAACLKDLQARGGDPLPAAATATGDCGVPTAVTFSRLRRPDGSAVLLDSPVTIRCTLALELVSWIVDDLLPIVRRHGADLVQLTGVGGHACRMRNAQAGAPRSEHASGNAFDLRALVLKDGRVVQLNLPEPGTKAMREEIRKSVCERFRTVLGAGSDSFHSDHLHLDMRERARGARLCQWLVE